MTKYMKNIFDTKVNDLSTMGGVTTGINFNKNDKYRHIKLV